MNSQINQHSLFVSQIEQAMRALVGSIEDAEIRKYGLQAASDIYDRLLPYRNMSNGIPQPNAVTKEQAVAEAYAIAYSHLNLPKFVDFSQIDFLLSEGYKDAAAVMCGSELEKHLRKLCVSSGIDVFLPPGSTGEPQPKKAERLNADLASLSVYNKLEQKQVTSWLDLRNKSAHGDYHEYTVEQVSLMVQGVRGFIIHHPA
ncbi:MAG: hypothetical protein H0V70_30135 [Ktedonobacteraceae bacterium]|nr:hypothetical protein [Ktedonobacteraceae bacterium]